MENLRITPGFYLTLALYLLAGRAGLLWCLLPAMLLHELGHAALIRSFGGETTCLTLGAGGLMLDYRGDLLPWQEVLVALAGPAVNLLTAISCAVLYRLGVISFSYAAGVNLILAVWNLLPVTGMDGGAVLAAILGCFLPRLRAERIFTGLSLIFSVGILLFGLYIAVKTRYNISVLCLGVGLLARTFLSDKSDKRIYK